MFRLRIPAETLAPLVVAALLLTVAVANLLWDAGVPSTSNPARLSPSVDPFPLSVVSPHLYVLPVPYSTNQSTWLTLLSIQGLANRNRPALYFDVDNETSNASSMLSFLVAHYGVSFDVVTMDWVYSQYLPTSDGVVVVDPSRPESLNVGTMVASLENAVLVGPETAPLLERQFHLRVVLDYASSNWTSSDSVSVYDRALTDLYPRLNPNLMAILPPDRLPLRDYLIATRTFVFYEPQGVLASPAELAATQRVLAALPHGTPILGWFDNPTLTEENAFIQLASHYGKAVFGSQDVPNLSVLTAYGRNETRTQPAPPPTPALENKAYLVVAVPDGDNLDFIAHRLRELWSEAERGTFPITWSLSPLLAGLAPPYLDYLYGSATPDDRFVLGPSGAGYAYPDYFGPGDLAPYLESTARYANATGMDIPWLLNAFVASEIPYEPATLSAYVDALHPPGIVLDYDDQAKTQEIWMQAGATAVAPVIRSTQLWTSMDNFFAKVGDAMATWDAGPHFLWVTVYTFRFDLHDAASMVRELANRTRGNLAVVTPEQLFGLMEEDFVARAHAQLDALRADPFAATFLAPQLEAAQARLTAGSEGGGLPEAAYRAYQGSVMLREAGLTEGVFALGLVLVAAALVSLWGQPRWGRPEARRVVASGRSFLILAAAFALFMLAVRAALAANFWSYQWIVAGVLLAGVGRPLRRYLDRAFPRVSVLMTASLGAAFVGLALGSNVAFVLAAIGTVGIIDSVLTRATLRPEAAVIAAALGLAVGFVAGLDWVTFAVLAAALVLPTVPGFPRSGRAEPRPSKGSLVRGLIVALPAVGLVVAFNFSVSLRLGLQGTDLGVAAAMVLAVGPLAGILAARAPLVSRTHAVQIIAFAVAAIALVLLGVTLGTVPTLVLLGVAVGALAVGAAGTLRRFAASGHDAAAAVGAAISWIPLILLFVRMPPVIYSLALVHLPEIAEASLYAPEYLFAAVAATLAVWGYIRYRREAALRTRSSP